MIDIDYFVTYSPKLCIVILNLELARCNGRSHRLDLAAKVVLIKGKGFK